MNSRVRLFLTALCFGAALTPIAYPAHAARATPVAVVDSARQPLWKTRQPRFIEFNAPGSATATSSLCPAPNCGTTAYANNDSGAVVGYYTDKYYVPHAFLRRADGSMLTFDAPGAGLGHGLYEGTAAFAINRSGAIAGTVEDPSQVNHGFLRHPDGTFTNFNAPLAASTKNAGTLAWDINSAEQTAGVAIDAKGVYHGFLRDSSGKAVAFDPPGSFYTYVCEETCLATDGTVAGFYYDAKQVLHGFVRAPDGSFTTFSAPGAGTGAGQGVIAGSINDHGDISGYVVTADNSVVAFLRYRNGSVSEFPVRNSQTVAVSINRVDAIAGDIFDKNFVLHGAERWPNGAVATFNAPDAPSTPGSGPRVSTNNAWGEVTGWYHDKKGLSHGFVWLP